ncbi:NAD-dependent epimerase/dehydratase family protein [Candidatus Hydrogenedentota bacterium]
MNRILVTGSEGYIGSVLVPMLLERGYDVTGLDTCFYSEGNLTGASPLSYDLIKKDVRDVEQDDLKNFDAIIHLAALSNDPLGKLSDSLTMDINFHASVRLAELAKRAGVERFIFASSCSLYGQSDHVLTEEDLSNPQTAYGKSKIMAEQGLSGLADDAFSPIFMRNATAFGISPRMRFDIVVNNLTGYAKTTGRIQILGDGTPWRPLVHVRDISSACIQVLKAGRSQIHNQAFNIGDSAENFQIKTIAEKISEEFRDCAVTIAQENAGDTRNYIVSFDKVKQHLGFQIEMPLVRGIRGIKQVYDKIELDRNMFDDRLYTRLKQIEWLLEQNKLNSELRWQL